MPKYTRRHYIDIGTLINNIPKKHRKSAFNKWDKIFKKDNPRYKSKLFKKFIRL